MAEQFRIAVFGEPRAPWRDCQSQALGDAKALGLASYDRTQREWFLAVPVEMQRIGQPDRRSPDSRDRRGEPWTPAEVGELRTLLARGECARLIGRRMGRTPAAVSSKTHRHAKAPASGKSR